MVANIIDVQTKTTTQSIYKQMFILVFNVPQYESFKRKKKLLQAETGLNIRYLLSK